MQKSLLEMKNIEKGFGHNKVLKGVSISVAEGEVISLVGENGAGKSTLMNTLFGMPSIVNTGGYDGEILWEGNPVKMDSPHKAMELGIGMVHQEFMLLPGYSITENVKLNREIVRDGFASKVSKGILGTLDWEKMTEETDASLDRIHLKLDPDEKVGNLTVGYKQFIEIAREIDKKNIKLIVFDEPTAVLTDVESQWLLNTIKEISKAGISVIFISHKLNEVIEISDKIYVLRDGEKVDEMKRGETDTKALAKAMVGRDVDFSSIAGRSEEELSEKNIILKVRDLKVDMPGEQTKGIDLDIRDGEILGICGLAGQGKLSIANGIAGIYPATGEVMYKGEKLPFQKPLEILKKGIECVSEDRKGIGLLLHESISLNTCLLAMYIKNSFFSNFGFFKQMNQREMQKTANEMIKELGVKCTGPGQALINLSGGNQQKVCIARAVVFNPKVLFVSEPTRGIDIGAKKVILDYLVKMNRSNGTTIVVTSSELNELRSICDRIAIVYDGKVKAILKPTDSNEKFGMLMSGLDA